MDLTLVCALGLSPHSASSASPTAHYRRGEEEWAVGVGLDYHSTGSPAHPNETTCDESPLLMTLVV